MYVNKNLYVKVTFLIIWRESKENGLNKNATARTKLKNNDTLASEIKWGKKDLTTELPASKTEPVDHGRRDGGRVLFVRRKVRVNKRQRQKASTNSSPRTLPSLSHSEFSLKTKDPKLDRPPSASSSSILYSVEQLRQFLGQEASQSQTGIQGEDDNMHSARGDSQTNKELPDSLPDNGPVKNVDL